MAQVSGMKLSLGTLPARTPASRPRNPKQWTEELSRSNSVRTVFFFLLGFKGYLQPSCLGPLARVGERGRPTTGVSAADKRRKARRGGDG